ncbi:MAG: hypothetical protein CMJ64_14405 [Planctomycetaceae bacterium]|nr:hypothetical protein [Planctomycetaceae bacterium]
MPAEECFKKSEGHSKTKVLKNLIRLYALWLATFDVLFSCQAVKAQVFNGTVGIVLANVLVHLDIKLLAVSQMSFSQFVRRSGREKLDALQIVLVSEPDVVSMIEPVVLGFPECRYLAL